MARDLTKIVCLSACAALALASVPRPAEAQRGAGLRAASAGARPAGGGQARQVRSQAAGSINSTGRVISRDVQRDRSRDVNIDRTNIGNNNNNINIGNDVDIDVDKGWGNNWDYDHYHPIATAAVVTAAAVTTAWVVGSYYRTLPANCVAVYRSTVVYYQCGNYWYQPIYSGSSVQYVAVIAP